MSVDQSTIGGASAVTGRVHISRHATAAVQIDAPPLDVWRAIADIGQQNRWSGEAKSCEWLAPADGPVPGARFRGSNRRGFRRWTRDNVVVAAEPGVMLHWKTLPSRMYPDSTEWHLDLSPYGAGTEVRESYRVLSLPRPLEIFLFWFNPTHRERTADLEDDLLRLKAFIEAPTS